MEHREASSRDELLYTHTHIYIHILKQIYRYNIYYAQDNFVIFHVLFTLYNMISLIGLAKLIQIDFGARLVSKPIRFWPESHRPQLPHFRGVSHNHHIYIVDIFYITIS